MDGREQERYIAGNKGQCLIVHHNHDITKEEEELCDFKDETGVAIGVLSPEFVHAYETAGRLKPITVDQGGQFCGRFIGIPLMFPDFNSDGKRIKGNLKIF